MSMLFYIKLMFTLNYISNSNIKIKAVDILVVDNCFTVHDNEVLYLHNFHLSLKIHLELLLIL